MVFFKDYCLISLNTYFPEYLQMAAFARLVLNKCLILLKSLLNKNLIQFLKLTFLNFMSQCNYSIFIDFSVIWKWIRKKMRRRTDDLIWQSFIRKAVLAQNTDSNENCSESLSIENDIDQSLNIENNVEMRIKAVKNTKSLRENTETKIFITGIETWAIKKVWIMHKIILIKIKISKIHFKAPPANKFSSKLIHECRRQFKMNYSVNWAPPNYNDKGRQILVTQSCETTR